MKVHWSRRGSYFFVIDAFIGSIIIIAAIVAIYSGFSSQQSSRQTFYNAEDVLTVMDSTQLRNYGYESGDIKNMMANGTITDTKLTLLQQLVLFYDKYKYDGSIPNYYSSASFANEIAQRTPNSTGIAIFMNDYSASTILAQRNADPNGANISEGNATVVITSQRIVILQRSATSLYQPVIVEVHTWQ